MLKPTRADKILIACLFAANLALFSGIDYTRTAGDWVVIEVSQKEVQRLPLGKNQLVHVTGPLGETEVETHDGKARILKSPCHRKLCIKSGYIQYADRIAACLPNRVVVRILGSTYRGIDAVVS
ncbi:NusG domain II-containing protein [Nitrospina watsonii]|uniref:NusG_II domain-containing protein n=1 Tax=Nitrospina watsonii TaxID=1323948 RepID=A0ABM9HFI8_9BACT|nr:NusG domain II-containing protein [Nitrospina watsonii]CAI2718922.1 NusG_II domain-containing protein [Nitrospina watsonii]